MGYTTGSSGRASVAAWGLFSSKVNSDLLLKTAPRPPGWKGSIRLVATASDTSFRNRKGQIADPI